MPTLQITECVSCPYHRSYSHDDHENYVGDDSFFILCKHPEQNYNDGIIAKIKNKCNNIYFKCPLDESNNTYTR